MPTIPVETCGDGGGVTKEPEKNHQKHPSAPFAIKGVWGRPMSTEDTPRVSWLLQARSGNLLEDLLPRGLDLAVPQPLGKSPVMEPRPP